MAKTSNPQPEIVDQVAFERACGLLLVDIPAHVNECIACRKGQAAVHAALDGKPAGEIDHEAFRVATELFCAVGQQQTTEYGEMVKRALGV